MYDCEDNVCRSIMIVIVCFVYLQRKTQKIWRTSMHQKAQNICVVSHFSTCTTGCTQVRSAQCTAPTCQTRLAICWRCVLTRDLTKHLYLCAPNVAKVIIATIITITDGPPASPLPLLFLDQTLRVQVLLEVQVREANC